MAATNMAFLRARAERKEYDTLWKEKPEEEIQSPSEIAGNAEVDVELPQSGEAEAPAEEPFQGK